MPLFTLSDLDLSGANSTSEVVSSSPNSQLPSLNDEPSTRRAWHAQDTNVARCDLSIERLVATPHAGLTVFSLWKKSIKGRALTDIKADDAMIPFFATHISAAIQRVLGTHLDNGTWAICASPRRRHLEHNFGYSVAQAIANALHITFYEDVALARTRERIGAVFELGTLPSEPNLIVFDDFVTTGSTLQAMNNLLAPLNKTLIYFVGINNNF